MSVFKHKLLSSVLFSLIISTASFADSDVLSLFPLENYDQTVSHWIKPDAPNHHKSVFDKQVQQEHMTLFLAHYVGEYSPWNAEHVNKILQLSSPDDLASVQQSLLSEFSNEGKADDQIGYGENYRPHEANWIRNIANSIDLSQLINLNYQAENRGIAIDNLHARALPTQDVHYFSHRLAGQGYPFDNLQMSALWAGTPVYIIAQTRDKSWSLVLTPEYIAWVQSKGIAHVNANFVDIWTKASQQHLAAITHTQTAIVDQKGEYLFTAYVGSVFPANKTNSGLELLVPDENKLHQAIIKRAAITPHFAELMPLSATPHQFARLMQTLIGRPYGWGSMYFYNDCSAELKSLLTPFGIWLPRNSAAQISVGKTTDLSNEPANQRLDYLMKNGHPFTDIIYIGGHIIMYVGNYTNPKNGEMMALTYQNLWGLSPNPPNRRAVVGQSVLLPMLLEYPEDSSLNSLANKKYFEISDLSQLSHEAALNKNLFNLKLLMYPSLLFKS